MKTELLKNYSPSTISGLVPLPIHDTNRKGRGRRRSSRASLGGSRRKSIVTTGEVPRKETPYGRYGCFSQWKERTFRKKILYKLFPIFTWLPEYNLSKAISDFIAGLIVAQVLIAQSLGIASIGGFAPEYGLYSAFVGCFVYIIFGGQLTTTLGPTPIMAIMTLSYTSNEGEPREYAILMTFMTGVILLSVGILQLGFIVNFISSPVISGFISAIAITIISTQIKGLLGIAGRAIGVIDVIRQVIEKLDGFNSSDALLALVCVIVLLFLQSIQTSGKCLTKLCKKPAQKLLWFISIAKSAIVLSVCTIIYNFEYLAGNDESVEMLGYVAKGLPNFEVPKFNLKGRVCSIENGTETCENKDFSLNYMITEQATALIVLPFLALMETYSAAKTFCGAREIDASQELIAVGLSNFIGSFFSSMPVAANFTRTTINYRAGAKTPMSNLVTGIVVLLSLLFLTQAFYYIPRAALAAVNATGVLWMIDFGIVYPMWKSKPMDIIPWLVTLLVSILVGLDIGILAGFLISLMFLLYYAARPGVKVKRGETSFGTKFILVELDRSLTFASIEYTRHIILKTSSTYANNTLPIVIDCQHVSFSDFTAAQGVRDLVKFLNEKKEEVILWQIKESIVRVMTGVMEAGNVPFKFCMTEEELEKIIESLYGNEMKETAPPDIMISLSHLSEMEETDEDEETIEEEDEDSYTSNETESFDNNNNNRSENVVRFENNKSPEESSEKEINNNNSTV